VFSDEHTFKQFKGGNPRHNFVWAKSVSEVPGKEVERWGLAVNTWAGFSSRGKTKLAFYEGTLDAPAYQDILQQKLLPAAQEWYEDENEGWDTATGQGVLSHGNSPPRVGWSSMALRWWKSGPLRGMTLTRSRTFGLSLTRDLRTKSLRQKKE
jgi:hypothetical protein